VTLPQLQQKRLDMLAGAQRIQGEVRAGAVILKQTQAANRYPVAPPASGLDAVIPIRPADWPLQHLEWRSHGSLSPLGDLLFDQHRKEPLKQAVAQPPVLLPCVPRLPGAFICVSSSITPGGRTMLP
jgi:hypothetical protein